MECKWHRLLKRSKHRCSREGLPGPGQGQFSSGLKDEYACSGGRASAFYKIIINSHNPDSFPNTKMCAVLDLDEIFDIAIIYFSQPFDLRHKRAEEEHSCCEA